MTTKTTTQKLRDLIMASYAGLFVRSHEEQRVQREFLTIATQERFTLYSWTLTGGLRQITENETSLEPVSGTGDPLKMLERFKTLPERSIVLAADFHLYAEGKNPLIIRMVKDCVRLGGGTNRVLAILGCRFTLPAELEKEFTLVEFGLPGRDTLGVILDTLAPKFGVAVNGTRESILDAASGLTCGEAEDAITLAFVETGTIEPAVIARMKSGTVKKSGVLEIVETATDFSLVGGMDEAKGWLRTRKLAFTKEAKAYGLPTAKGVLCVGVSGCGKSLLAKATASLFGVPLLRLDGGKLYGSLVGESERLVRLAIETAEAVGSCVLWIDEIEKALAKGSGQTDGGTSARVLGTFLQWLQEKTSQVFVFATANDISQLPPELLRKGRWDELFFCDLPTDSERSEIWSIQIARKGRKPADFPIASLTQQTVGWSGAEIEGAFNDALFSAFAAGSEPHLGKHLESAVAATVPLSRTRSEDIDKLRAWAAGRARLATKPSTAGAIPSRRVANN